MQEADSDTKQYKKRSELEGEELLKEAEKPVSSRSGSNLEMWFAKKRQLVDKRSDGQSVAKESLKSYGVRSKLTVDSIQSSNFSLSKSGAGSSEFNPKGKIFLISEHKQEEDADSNANKENHTRESNEEELSYISKA